MSVIYQSVPEKGGAIASMSHAREGVLKQAPGALGLARSRRFRTCAARLSTGDGNLLKPGNGRMSDRNGT